MMLVGSFGAWIAFVACASARAETADRVRYVVGTRIVTASDVRLEAALALHDRSPMTLPGPSDPETRAVDMAVLRERAGDAVIYRPSPSDVRGRLDRLRSACGTEWSTFLDAWGLDEQRLEGILFSRMVVERYVLRNAPRAAEGVDADAGAWMREQRSGVRVVALDGP